MSFTKAKKMFDEGKRHLDREQDGPMWDLMNGLSELAESLNTAFRSLQGQKQEHKEQLNSD